MLEHAFDDWQVEATAVVGHREPQAITSQGNRHADGSVGGLVRSRSHGWCLDAVIDRIPDEMQQRFTQRLEHHTVRLDRIAFRDDPDLLAHVARDIARRSLQRVREVAQRTLSQVAERSIQASRDGRQRTRVLGGLTHEPHKLPIHDIVGA